MSALSTAQEKASPAGKNAPSFTLSGTVVNSVTGEPIPHALVQLNSMMVRTAFTDGEGHFQIEGLPAAAVTLGAQKPGYFAQQDLKGTAIGLLVDVGPDTGPVVLKLTPAGAIYGRVTDASGQPVEHVPLRLKSQNVRDGRKRWDSMGFQESDEDGRFRFANLMPGKYYLAAGPASTRIRLLAEEQKAKTGYPSLYYPGVPDLASASPIQLGAGQQAQADFSLSAVPVYQIPGTVTGYPPDQGVSVQFFNQSGDELLFSLKFNQELGTFEADGVPAGQYLVKASSQTATGEGLRAEARVSASASSEGVHLALAPAISIPIVVRMEPQAPSSQEAAAWMQGPPPVRVHLTPLEPNSSESYSTLVTGNPGHFSLVLQNVDPGGYAVELTPQGPWYVQSATYGPTNLLYDDITVTTAGQSRPLEIVLRDDSASLSGTVKSGDGHASEATVVAVPNPPAKKPAKVGHAGASGFTLTGLAPGEYLVYALDRTDGLDYTNPAVLEAYASQAAHVTVQAGQKAQATLDLIHVGDGG